MTNQTTYEVYYKNKMEYILKFKELKKLKLQTMNEKISHTLPFHPFDLGIINNIKLFYKNKTYQ
jgi:hypothetical protein